MAAGSQKDWSPGQNAFRQLLRWLDEGVDSGGEKYLETRRRLVKYFDRKNCIVPDELADETLNRVARRLAEEGVTSDDPPARYCYIMARFVFLEYHRRPARAEVSLDGLPFTTPSALSGRRVRHRTPGPLPGELLAETQSGPAAANP